jgi:tetratricopeptide (TPR) repeat protein
VTELPPWCAPPPDPIERPALLDAAVAAALDGPVTLTGAGGVGTTSFAGMVVDALARRGAVGRVAAVAVDATTERPDVVLALGIALRATLPGDEASLIDALRRGPPLAVLLDDADLAPDAVRHVVGLTPSVIWVATGRGPVIGTTLDVPPFSAEALAPLCPPGRRPEAYHGRPLLPALAPGLDPESDWSASLIDAWPALRLLADLPMGRGPADGPLPPAAVRDVRGRPRPRRAFREAIGLSPTPSPSSLLRVVEQDADRLHRLACDLAVDAAIEDLRLLRTAAHVIEDPRVAALAAAAAARMHIRYFQASEALDLVRGRLRAGGVGPMARGLLRWLEGDALLTQGSTDLAEEAHTAAEAALRVEGGAGARIALARRCADEWAARGSPERARAWLAIAREALGQHPDAKGLSDILRIRANLAAQAGELVGAGSLYDEALATLAGHPDADRERAFIRVGQAAIAMARGQWEDARQAVARAADETRGHPLAEAAVAWRRTELAARRGALDDAYEALANAVEAFRAAGALRGLLACARMEGDLAALAGDHLAAVAAWRHGVTLAVRTRSLPAMHRLLQRLHALEREGAAGPHVDELAANLADVAALLGRA